MTSTLFLNPICTPWDLLKQITDGFAHFSIKFSQSYSIQQYIAVMQSLHPSQINFKSFYGQRQEVVF